MWALEDDGSFCILYSPISPIPQGGGLKIENARSNIKLSTLPYVRRISTAAPATGAGSGVYA